LEQAALDLIERFPEGSPTDAAHMSAAISLKRIADVLERMTEGSGDRWHHAIMDMAHQAGESFERGRARGR